MANAAADDGNDRRRPSDVWIDCPPSILAKRLLEERFENDATATAVFLLECVSSLPDAESISAKLVGGGGGEDVGDDDREEEDPRSTTTTEEASVVVSPANERGDDENGAAADGPLGSILPFPRLDRSLEDEGPTTTEVSCVQPRGKFALEVRERGLRFVHARGEEMVVRSSDVRRVVVFPKPEDCRRSTTTTAKKKARPGSMALAILRREEDGTREEGEGGARWKGKRLSQVCFQLPPVPIGGDGDAGEEEEDPERDRIEVLDRSLRPPSLDGGDGDGGGEKFAVIRVANPSETGRGRAAGYAFRSEEGDFGTSSTTGGMPFVKCHMGVNDGALYPLPEGLLFYKPPTFVHRSDLRSVACGRGNGGSRYVDLVATLDRRRDDDVADEGSDGDDEDESETMEFANIDRNELGGLNEYVREALTEGAAGGGGDDGGGGRGDVAGGSDGGEDEDAARESDGGERKKSRRAASREARVATRREMLRSTTNDTDDSDGDEGDAMYDPEGDVGSSEEEEEAEDYDDASDSSSEESADEGEDFSPDDETESDEDDGEEEREESDDDDDDVGRPRKKARK